MERFINAVVSPQLSCRCYRSKSGDKILSTVWQSSTYMTCQCYWSYLTASRPGLSVSHSPKNRWFWLYDPLGWLNEYVGKTTSPMQALCEQTQQPPANAHITKWKLCWSGHLLHLLPNHLFQAVYHFIPSATSWRRPRGAPHTDWITLVWCKLILLDLDPDEAEEVAQLPALAFSCESCWLDWLDASAWDELNWLAKMQFPKSIP